MKPIEVGCAIIRYNGKILIAQRKLKDTLGGYWEFPGGKKRLSETFEECLVREAEEELGIVIHPVRFLQRVTHAYSEKRLALHFYLCDWKSGDPCAKDCEAFAWILPEEMRGYKFPPADADIIEELILNRGEYFKAD